MYQGAVDFAKELGSQHAALYGLLTVGVVAASALALHTLYTLILRLGAHLRRRL